MGSVIKSGSAAIASVLPPGEKLKADQTGLVFAATPASDFREPLKTPTPRTDCLHPSDARHAPAPKCPEV